MVTHPEESYFLGTARASGEAMATARAASRIGWWLTGDMVWPVSGTECEDWQPPAAGCGR